MPNQSLAFLKASGLYVQPNQLEVQPGSLITASNVIISRDDVIQPRRGFRQYSEPFGSNTDIASQLMEYRNRIILHYNNTLIFDTQILDSNNLSIFSAFAGTYSEVEPGLRIKSIEANKNLYFTTSDGIKKISAVNASEFTTSPGFITNAGGIKALDVTSHLDITYGDSSGFLPADSAVAYRIVWGTKDANGNLILGTPSSRTVIYNPLLGLMLSDYAILLYNLDQLNTFGSIVNDGNYLSTLGLPISADSTQLYNSLLNLCFKLDNEEGDLFSTAQISSAAISSGVCTITLTRPTGLFGKVQIGDKIYISGFNPSTTGTLNGVQIVSDISDNGTNSFISFNTDATGTVSITSASIQSGWFRGITIPNPPSIPTTHDENAALQLFIQNIIFELQSTHNIMIVANNDGVASQQPIEITTSTITGTTTLTINFDTSSANTDARLQFQVGDYVTLAGTWTSAGAENIDGTYLVATTASSNITLTLTSAFTNGAVSLDTTSDVSRILRYSDALKVLYIDILEITTSANVILDIVVPADATINDFYQVYRSDIITATGTDILLDLIPNDEMKLVYEAYPTQTQIDTKLIEVTDIVPDSFTQGVTNLYTNEISGEGILQSNDIPPLAKDIAVFKNYTWYANTTTRQRLDISLLGVTKILNEFNAGNNPSLTIANANGSNTYRFVKGVQETSTITTNPGSTLNASGPASYFLINGGNDVHQYYAWYAIGTATDPVISNRIPIKIYALAGDTAIQIAQKTTDALNTIVFDFIASYISNVVTVTNIIEGPTTDLAVGTSGFTVAVTIQGQGQNIKKQVTSITAIAGSLYQTSGTADYFTINTAFDRNLYAFWFNVTGGSMVAPVLSGRTVLPIVVLTTDTNAQVATKIANALTLTGNYTTSVLSNVVTVTTLFNGPTTNTTEVVVNAGFLISTLQTGALDVLLSNLASPSLAVEATAQSLVYVINQNNADIVNAFYISGIVQTPGEFLLEAKNLSTPAYYILTNSSGMGSSFSPDLSPTKSITSISVATETVITATSHDLNNGDQVLISGSNSIPSIDGVYTVSNVTTNTFTIPVNVITAGNTGSLNAVTNSVVSDNEVTPNRVYYSKLQQPEAVPLLNFLDVGSANKAILRIVPLRDSLFVFKEDGLYRISGESPPWNLALFDATTKLIATDSIGSASNLIYGWMKQGISTVSESGVKLISRPIDTIVQPVGANPAYTNFGTATWGLGYESDNAYYLNTVINFSDTVATICYRYSNLTNTWTTFDTSNTCGIIKFIDDKLYMGDGNLNQIVVERKDFSRTDYADKQYNRLLQANNYFASGTQIKLNTTAEAKIGDVLVQEQTITIYTYNQLLKKLDKDPQIVDSDYFATLAAQGGDDMRTKLVELTIKLDADPGLTGGYQALIISQNSYPIVSNSANNPTVITSINHELQTGRIIFISGVTGSSPTINGTYTVTRLSSNTFSIPITVLTGGTGGTFTTQDNSFADLEACYNLIITALNNDPGAAFINYQPITNTTSLETIIQSVNVATGQIMLAPGLEFIVGPMILYKQIDSTFTYSPLTLGDPVGMKHLNTATVMFQDKTFTKAILSFSTDLLPEFQPVPFNAYGNGIFGHDLFGQGYFGGASHSAPFRTYVPRTCQRCRYINMKFEHSIARESYSIYGISLTGRSGLSSRAYR